MGLFDDVRSMREMVEATKQSAALLKEMNELVRELNQNIKLLTKAVEESKVSKNKVYRAK